jgi:hypothetical protein
MVTLCTLVCLRLKVQQQVIPLTRGPGRLKTSDSAPVLQCGSGPSSDFLAKILVADTPLFLCNTQFYLPLSSLLLHKHYKGRRTYVVSDNSDGSMFACDAGSWGLIVSEVIFVMASEATTFHLFF